MRRGVALRAGLALALSIGSVARADGWRAPMSEEPRVDALTAPDREARRAAARWLGRHGDPDVAVSALLERLDQEGDVEVRIAIADALARRRDPRAAMALAAPLPGMRSAEREARMRALAAIDDPLARRALAESLAGPGAAIARPIVIDAGAAMIDVLAPLLAIPASARDAAAALGAIGDARGAEALALHAADPDPGIRAAVVAALGAIGDPRALPIVRAALEDADATVVAAALDALARVGSIEDVPAIEARIAREPAIAIAALRAWIGIDAPGAAARIAAGIDPAIAGAVRAAALDRPHPALVPWTAESARESPDACDALARIDDDAAARALVAIASPESGAPAAAEARLSLAIALRRGRHAERALEALRAEPDALRRAWLLAIARAPEGAEQLDAVLTAGDPAARAVAATGAREIERAIAAETDPVALEALARAIAEREGTIDPALPLALLDPAAQDARLVLASVARPSGSPEIDRDLVRSIHEAARALAPRTRAVAIEALARRGIGLSTIASALEDPVAEVRLAAARALPRLPERPGIAERLASRLAVEADPRVRRALRDAIARRAPASGDECLIARLERPARSRSVVVEVVLEDGRWLRVPTLPSGELVVCGLPGGEADLRLPP